MRRGIVSLLVLGLCLGVPSPAFARRAPITGRLSKRGYTVIALGYNGRAVVSKARSFRIVPRDRRVTLQLRDAKGRYAGPVVVGGTARRAIVGVKAGARLGRVQVRRGYATARLAKRSRDRSRWAQAKRGVPRGNGRNFGLVRSRRRAAAGGGRDQDRDGVPDALDIDVNGNLVINNEDSSGAKKGKAAQVQPAGFSVFSQIGARLDRSVNANAAGVSDADIDQLMRGATTAPPFQPIGMFLVFQFPTANVELDCGGLSYCSPGGTGRVRAPGGRDPGPSFPSCCDTDGNGFGTLTGEPGPGGTEAQLYPMATASQIKSGDVLVAHAGATATPTTLNFVFNTTPALLRWSSSGGQSGSVGYPVGAGAQGTDQNPFGVGAGADGHVAVTMTFWRPQRRAIAGAGEGSGFIDIGHLLWEARLVTPQTVVDCPTGYSSTDPNLVPSGDPMLGGFVDQAADAPADPAHTLTFTLDFNACLASRGITWQSGEDIQLEIVARSPVAGDNSAQQVIFRRM